MKCPKCGYLGFETTDRCRNCQYDFSLAPLNVEPDLALQESNRSDDPNADFSLPALSRVPDGAGASPLDLDRLFGEADAPVGTSPPAVEAAPAQADAPSPTPAMGSEVDLPFDDEPLPATPRAARPPLGVRRTTPEIPRNRPRTTRTFRVEPQASTLAFDAEPRSASAAEAPGEPAVMPMRSPTLGVRVAAGAIDVTLLGVIDLLIVFLTLRIAGLQITAADVRVLLSVPLLVFLGLLAFGYVASFTVAGGQTIGKMLMKLRVLGDDGRAVDAAGGVLRAAGCMLVPLTLGVSFLPVLFTPDQRALHDRLAGTRVVCE